jgi:putative N6-adenine-specific DNA methylase
LREKKGIRPDSGSDRTQGVCLYLFWKDDEAGIFLNTSGDTISRHGYRKIPGLAPLQESLAAGLISAIEWDINTPFVNPMCGSGTLAIEAALLATGRFTYHSRNEFAFKYIKGYNRLIAAEVLNKMPMQESQNLKIYASDIDPRILSGAKQNAKMAGVEQFIQFEQCDYRECFVPKTDNGGVVILNPPYGKRLEDPELNQSYKEIGDFFKKRCTGYNGFIFTGNLEALKFLGLKSYFKLQMYSAQLECRLAAYKLY